MRHWQIFALVVTGALVGIAEPGRFEYALGVSTLYVFLPPLLFEAAWNLRYRAILRHRAVIAILAGPGVVLTAAIVAAMLVVLRVPLGPALLTGAILSATDPIAVIAVLRRVRVPLGLATIVECEALFNDAVAVALYRGVLAALTIGVLSWQSAAAVALGALAQAAGGVFLGIATAFLIARVLRGRRNAALQVVATLLAAYGAYFAADAAHLSGIFSTIACGIALRYCERRWMTLRISAGVAAFWDAAAMIANALVFFLVGAALQLGHEFQEPLFIVSCLAGVLLARLGLIALVAPCGYPQRWLAVVSASGMRGALSCALAIALPYSIPYRAEMLAGAFAVVLVTMLVGALTIERAAAGVKSSSECGP